MATTYPAADSPIGNIASLHNKVALITGGSSGLGRAIAQAYAAAGAYIVSADLQEDPPHAPIVEEALKGTGADFRTPTVELVNRRWPAASGDGGVKKREQRAVFVRTDVTDEESVKAAVKTAVDVYGRLDIMVNNAGMSMFSFLLFWVSVSFRGSWSVAARYAVLCYAMPMPTICYAILFYAIQDHT